MIMVGTVLGASLVFPACGSDEEDEDSSQGTGASGASGSGASGSGASGSGASGSGASGSGASGGSPDGGAGVGGSEGGAGGGTGGDGEGGEGQGGMDPGEACNDCLEPLTKNNGACVTEFEACDDDAMCNTWLDCVDDCGKDDWSTTCLDACDGASPEAATLFGALTTCGCMTCTADCGPYCG
jgi:hypothetical protein